MVNKEIIKAHFETTGGQIEMVSKSLNDASIALKYAPQVVRHLLSKVPEDIRAYDGDIEFYWQKFYIESIGYVSYKRSEFMDFVKASWPRGLSSNIEKLKKLCRDDIELLNLFDQVSQGKVGGNNPLGINQYENDELKEVELYNIQPNQTAPTGTTKQAGLRRLRKHREDLHKAVLDGEMTVNAAMIEAGFRSKAISMPQGTNIERWIEVITMYFSEDDRQLIADNII